MNILIYIGFFIFRLSILDAFYWLFYFKKIIIIYNVKI